MQRDDGAKAIRRLKKLVEKGGSAGVRRLSREELRELPALYRHGCSVLARLETQGTAPERARELARVVAGAHGILHRPPASPASETIARLGRFFLAECPRTLRAEWRLLAASFAVVYGLALAAYLAVMNDFGMAFSLLHPAMVTNEIQQLESTAPGEPFRGNFTFGLGESPTAASHIMFHNMGVGVMFFVSALVPPLYLILLATNALMLGTYTAVAAHWGQAGAISSILWCHGTLEIQAIVFAGTAGLVLLRSVVAPGAHTRRHAMSVEGARAWRILAPTFPILFISGLIEGFISPHAPFAVRIATAVVTGVALLTWALMGGRAAGSQTRA